MNGIFDTKKEAIVHLVALGFDETRDGGSFYQSGRYNLSHGEYDRPDYKPVYYKSLGGWAVKVIYYYYHGTCNVPCDGPIELWLEFDDEFRLCYQPIELG